MAVKKYLVLEDIPGGQYKKGAEVGWEDTHAGVKRMVDLKWIQEVAAADPFDAMSGRLTDQIAEKLAKAFGKLWNNEDGTKAFGPRITPGEQEADRNKSWSDWARQAEILSNYDANPQLKAKAHERIVKSYGSSQTDWSDLNWGGVEPDIKIPAGREKAALNFEASGTAGGYTAPPEYVDELFRLAMEQTIFADKCAVRPMSSNTMFYYKLDQTGTVTANQITGYLGGAYLQWAGEQGTGNQASFKLKQASTKAEKLQGYAPIPIELLDDSKSNFDVMLRDVFADAVSYYVDYAFINGNGVGKPQGYLNSPAAIGFNRAGGAGTATLAYADLAGLENNLLEHKNGQAIYIFHSKAKQAVLTMADASNRLVVQPYYPGTTGGPATVPMPMTIFGRRFFFTEKVPTFGTAGDISLVNPAHYFRGDRLAIEIAASPHFAFTNYEMTYRIVCRVAGQAFLDKAFTLIDGTSKLSSFSYLQ